MERVSRLVLYGGHARGICRRGNPEGETFYRAIIELARHGCGTNDPSFRQVFTTRFIPEATAEQLTWFNELTEGLANAEIGKRMSISEKTVRNHISNVFDRLGVWTRAQAIVFARDRGFRSGPAS